MRGHIIYSIIGWFGGTLLFLSGCTEVTVPSGDADLFTVAFASPVISASSATRNVSPLSDGTTLRILAFRRVGTSADLSVDKYQGEGTYEVSSGGSGSLTAVSPLLLSAGTYDFYALTPALTVTTGSNANGNTYTVSVEHGMDYATSLTESVAVSGTSLSVNLDALIRRCAKLTFVLSPKEDNITAVNISSAGVTNMTDVPVIASLNEPLNVSGLSKDKEVSVSGFSAPDDSQPLVQESSVVVLPREAGAFNFKMTVEYDNNGVTNELSAPFPADLVFSAGMHYTFTVKMLGTHVDLLLGVSPWADSTLSTDTGGGNTSLTPSVWDTTHTTNSTNGGDLGE
ncbi:MAG: fimbrillin family protein [Bacteroides sp.]|nr:fimbrillin family protein [Bacteroides sp.]